LLYARLSQYLQVIRYKHIISYQESETKFLLTKQNKTKTKQKVHKVLQNERCTAVWLQKSVLHSARQEEQFHIEQLVDSGALPLFQAAVVLSLQSVGVEMFFIHECHQDVTENS